MTIVTARESTLGAVLILLVIYLSWASPFFFTAGNLTVVGRQIALALLISVGMTFVILIGGIDLSVGSVVALVSVLSGQAMVTAGLPPAVAVVTASLQALLSAS
jgi:ribose/xylose/arabinose/galactoside ABC-type transport system permease subunit